MSFPVQNLNDRGSPWSVTSRVILPKNVEEESGTRVWNSFGLPISSFFDNVPITKV